MKRIYLDNAATTYTNADALQAMIPFFTNEHGNAASLHSYGRIAEKAVSEARAKIAAAINAKPQEIYFTSGATESNNWILNGIVRNCPHKRVLVSAIEHQSIMETCAQLEKDGYIVEYIKVGSDGLLSMNDLVARLSKPASLVSVMTANNEVGTIQYINSIASLCEQRGVPFHTDAAQALGSIMMNVKEMKIDALSLSSHKVYGPKGVGALYVRDGFKVDKFMHGGHQERNRRAGTLNVPGIVGFGAAVEITMRDSGVNNGRIKTLREYMISQVQEKIPNVYLNGHKTQRLVNNVNLSFAGAEGEAILIMLDMVGIAASTGSACNSNVLEPSHVLSAMGVEDGLNQSSIRFSLGRNTTREDIDYVVVELVKIIKRLRSISAVKAK
ncbi:MAG: IscS subfamily cysteine desulfurase [Firmicutes bacterium]|nr:IscS subfamily cysteine desulfurase [Bacillota bacterium]